MALMPGTLSCAVRQHFYISSLQGCKVMDETDGSAIRRSVSFTILLGSAAILADECVLPEQD